jgi:hypothetical protein
MFKRILITCIMIACLCCAMIPQALTQDPITCEELQAEAQALVGNEADGDWKNHGQYVSTVAKFVDPYLESGEIDSVCASCIVNQFARGIPIEEQEPCVF